MWVINKYEFVEVIDMKKELIVVGECILWIIILVIVKIVLESFFSTLEDNQIINYVRNYSVTSEKRP